MDSRKNRSSSTTDTNTLSACGLRRFACATILRLQQCRRARSVPCAKSGAKAMPVPVTWLMLGRESRMLNVKIAGFFVIPNRE